MGCCMKIGLIDVDGHNFPNIPLMKISAWHKQQGDSVEWYDPMFSGHMEKIYMSKVFSFTPDYQYFIDADEIVKGGSGYCIKLVDGKEVYDKSNDTPLPYYIEHIYPDYSIYPELTKDTSFGRLTLGCPRGCNFCHTGIKDGLCSNKVADLSEFWNGQKKIVLLDQNILACKDWRNLLQQLADSKALVEFNGGLDVRLLTQEKSEMINQIKIQTIHFAWDRYEDKQYVVPKLEMFASMTNKRKRDIQVYVLVNFGSTWDQDIERVMTIRNIGFSPYIMRYNKESIPRGDKLNKLARWVNNRRFFWKYESYETYLEHYRETLNKSRRN